MIYQSTDHGSVTQKEPVKKVVKKPKRRVAKNNTEEITERKHVSDLKLDDAVEESEKITEPVTLQDTNNQENIQKGAITLDEVTEKPDLPHQQKILLKSELLQLKSKRDKVITLEIKAKDPQLNIKSVDKSQKFRNEMRKTDQTTQ